MCSFLHTIPREKKIVNSTVIRIWGIRESLEKVATYLSCYRSNSLKTPAGEKERLEIDTEIMQK